MTGYPGFQFTGWSGDATGTANPLSVTMDSDKTITANLLAPPPRSVSASQGTSYTGINIAWTEVTDVAGYDVYRTLNLDQPASATKINTSLVTGTSYEDSPPIAGANYYYFVSTVNEIGEEGTKWSTPFHPRRRLFLARSCPSRPRASAGLLWPAGLGGEYLSPHRLAVGCRKNSSVRLKTLVC